MAVKVAVAGKGGVGKTTLAAALARKLADVLRVLAVDCDPNPNLAESFELDSRQLPRFSHDDLRPVPGTLALVNEPELVELAPGRLWLLGGPPRESALNDAVARGIAGVLLAERFDCVVTDLGAGPEFTRMAVGGVLNPADVCFVLSDGGRAAELTAERIEAACADREVRSLRVLICAGKADAVASALVSELVRRST